MRSVSVRLTADIADYQRKFRQAGSDAKSLYGELDKANRADKLDKVTGAATGLGLGLIGAAAGAIKMAADFDKSMSGVRAATHASAADMDKLRGAAIKAGADTQYSATGAANAITELSKAGVSTADVLGGGLSGALSLAAAGELDVGEAAETAASAMTQFKLKGSDVPHVADLLAAAAGKAQGSVSDMGAALNQAGLIASGTGLSIEETTGTLAAFASAGLIGSDAGTSFKTMLQAVQAPAGKTKDMMDELGISLYDSSGQFIGIANFAQQLKDKLSILTPEVRANALATIFGSDATRAANILYSQGAEGIQKWINQTNDAGYAAETAAINTDNLAGDLERLKGSLDTVLIQGGGGAQGGLRVFAQFLEGLVNNFGKLPPAVTGTAVVLAGLTGAALLGSVGWLKYRAAMVGVNEQLIAMGPAGEKAAAGLSKARRAAAIATAAFVALEVAGVVFDKLGNDAPNVDKLTAALTNYAQTGQVAGEMTSAFGNNMSDFKRMAGTAEAATHGWVGALNDFTSAIPGVGSFTDWLSETANGESFNSVTEAMASLDDSLTSTMTTMDDAQKASRLWNDLLIKSGLDTDQLAKLLPNAYKKVGELNTAMDAGTGATSKLAGATDSLSASEKKAADEAKALQDAFDELFKRYLSNDQMALKLEQTIIDSNKELKDGTHTLSLNSEEGRKNRGAVLDRLDAINSMRDSEIQNGVEVGKADRRYKDQIDTLKKTMLHLGYTKADVEALIGKYRDIPKEVGTEIQQPGMSKALKDTQDLWKKLEGVDGNWVANIHTTGYAGVKNQLLGLLAAQQALKDGTSVSEARRELARFMATGGPVVGPGTGTSDSIAARLSNGEHVWTADEVAAIGGQEAMTRLRAAVRGGLRLDVGDDTPGYAGGGAVMMPFPTTAAKTKVPAMAGAIGGQTYKLIEAIVAGAFPGMRVLSDFRPGAVTLSGNRSYHAIGRAVDFPPSRPLAEFFHAKYMHSLKELITPYNDLNVWNGKPHRYTGAIWNQHNFAGGNAHDHVAMRNGGTITEPIMGIGASGRTYSFGENGAIEHVMPAGGAGAGRAVNVNVTFTGPIGSRYELQTWFAGMVDDLRHAGRL